MKPSPVGLPLALALGAAAFTASCWLGLHLSLAFPLAFRLGRLDGYIDWHPVVHELLGWAGAGLLIGLAAVATGQRRRWTAAALLFAVFWLARFVVIPRSAFLPGITPGALIGTILGLLILASWPKDVPREWWLGVIIIAAGAIVAGQFGLFALFMAADQAK